MSLTAVGGTLRTWPETLFAACTRGWPTSTLVPDRKRAGMGVWLLLLAMVPLSAQAQQPPAPFLTSRSVAWDGEITDNMVLRYRRVVFYPQAAERIIQAGQDLTDSILLRRVCTFPPALAEAVRRSMVEYEKTIYLSGFNKREEIREVKVQRSESRGANGCPEPPVVLHRYSINISTPERNIKFS